MNIENSYIHVASLLFMGIIFLIIYQNNILRRHEDMIYMENLYVIMIPLFVMISTVCSHSVLVDGGSHCDGD